MESNANCKKEKQRQNEEIVSASSSDINQTELNPTENNSRKGMFSMYIPFSNEAPTPESHSKCDYIKCENEAPRSHYYLVKLSDIVKPDKKIPLTCSMPEPYVGHSRRSLMHSFHSENFSCLNRLFPSLNDELKRRQTVPSNRNKPAVMSLYDTNMSHKTFIIEPTNDLGWNLITNCYSSFCEDLLRMFLEQIATDVFIEADGRRFGAHKSVLASRCRYFAGEFAVGFVENRRNVVILPDVGTEPMKYVWPSVTRVIFILYFMDNINIVKLPTVSQGCQYIVILISSFSFKVVHFALCHIYSGVSDIPEYVNKLELARVANLLSLDELNEQILLWYSGKYCHNFHEPCDICIAGVIKCLLISMSPLGCGLKELSHKCFLWIVKYFYLVWPNEAFAKLPKLYIQKCYLRVISDISAENFLDVLNGCDAILSSLPHEKWANLIEQLCNKVTFGATKFAIKWLDVTLIAILTSPNIPTGTSHLLTKCTYTAIEKAHPQQICRLYAHLSKILIDCGWDIHDISRSNSYDPHKSYVKIERIAYNWFIQCENALIRSAATTIKTESFYKLPEHLKVKLQTLGCIQRSLTPTFTGLHSGNTQNTSAHTNQSVPAVRMTKAQLQRTNFNKRMKEETQVKVASKPAKVINVKSRYLEPRARKDVVNECSVSSRNSPLHHAAPRRTLRAGPPHTSHTVSTENVVTSRSSGVSNDNVVTSLTSAECLMDSQSSNKYGTYTKSKRSDTQSTSTRAGSSNNSTSWHGRSTAPSKIPVYQCHKRDTSQPKTQVSLQSHTTQTQKKTKGKSSLNHLPKKTRN